MNIRFTSITALALLVQCRACLWAGTGTLVAGLRRRADRFSLRHDPVPIHRGPTKGTAAHGVPCAA
jgi:hypothetical protein